MGSQRPGSQNRQQLLGTQIRRRWKVRLRRRRFHRWLSIRRGLLTAHVRDDMRWQRVPDQTQRRTLRTSRRSNQTTVVQTASASRLTLDLPLRHLVAFGHNSDQVRPTRLRRMGIVAKVKSKSTMATPPRTHQGGTDGPFQGPALVANQRR